MKVKSLITFKGDRDDPRYVEAGREYNATFEPKYEQYYLKTEFGEVALDKFEVEVIYD